MTDEPKSVYRNHYGILTGRMNNLAPAVAYLTQSMAANRVARQMTMAGDMVDVSKMSDIDYTVLERRVLAFGDSIGMITPADFDRHVNRCPDPTDSNRPADEPYVREGQNDANRHQRRAERRYIDMKTPKEGRR